MTTELWAHNLFGFSARDGRFYGVVIGIVTNNQDPKNLHRVKVRFPWLSEDDESHWARVTSFMAGNNRGGYFLPEVDDEVLVAFEHGCVDHPFVIGALWNGKDSAPESNQDGENSARSITSRSGHIIRLGDKSGSETIEIIDKSGNNKIVVDTSSNAISIDAQGDINICSATGKIILKANGIELESQAGITAKGTQNVDISATGQVNVKGLMINMN